MIALALRSMGQRRLRAALTALAVLLGVAMISGTFVQTDQIRTAFNDIERTANAGVDAAITPRTAFTSTFSSSDTLDEALVARAAGVPGAQRAEGELGDTGSLVVNGRSVTPQYAPSLLVSLGSAPFNPLTLVRGRFPRARGEVVVNRKLADDEHLVPGQRVGVTTRSGVQQVTLVGIADFGSVSSLGGATLIVAPLRDVQTWSKRPGRVSNIAVQAAPGTSQEELVRSLQRVLPRSVEIKTGEQSATDAANDVNDAIGGFLTPLLLSFAGAALLVGAFIIFNTFSITVAERTREFGLLRALGATRRQIMGSVVVEALTLGVAASVAGLLLGLGFARLLGGLFDAAGMGIPRGAMHLAPRTIIVALAVGIGVTLGAAIMPALRATRVTPIAALQDLAPVVRPRARRRRAILAGLVLVAGMLMVVQGLLGEGSGTSKLSIVGLGCVLSFIGVAANARHIVRPLASAIGWPMARLGKVTGTLARENVSRNTGRTAVTAAALMVGLGLVVFVAVLASGLKKSIDGGLTDRFSNAGLIVTSTGNTSLSGEVGTRLRATPGVDVAAAQYVEEVMVNGRPVNAITDMINGVDPASFAAVYGFSWRNGSDAAIKGLRPGEALLEHQFADQHKIRVGQRFRVTAPSGRTVTLRAVAEYRDPTILQGLVVDVATYRRLSPATDPFVFYARLRPGTEAAQVRTAANQSLAAFPTVKVRTLRQYADWISARLDTIVYMLYALLAMSVVISLFGIANSLFLSIHERTREIGLLRAVGATPSQVRTVIREESIITAVIGGALGTVLGVVLAWLMTFALDDLGLVFHIPVLMLVLFMVLAVLVGAAAAMAPARRAARLDVLRAVTGE